MIIAAFASLCSAKEFSKWEESVNRNYKLWDVIKVLEVQPFYHLLPQREQEQIKSIMPEPVPLSFGNAYHTIKPDAVYSIGSDLLYMYFYWTGANKKRNHTLQCTIIDDRKKSKFQFIPCNASQNEWYIKNILEDEQTFKADGDCWLSVSIFDYVDDDDNKPLVVLAGNMWHAKWKLYPQQQPMEFKMFGEFKINLDLLDGLYPDKMIYELRKMFEDGIAKRGGFLKHEYDDAFNIYSYTVVESEEKASVYKLERW